MIARPESRLTVLERRASALEASVEELSTDTLAAFKTITDTINQLKEMVKTGFGEAHDFQGHLGANVVTKEDLTNLEMRITALETRIAQIEATMATKEDLANLETRMKAEMAAMEKRIYLTMDAQRESLFDGIRQLLQDGKS
jgi:uncharacterized coiled-coil protein SlyX